MLSVIASALGALVVASSEPQLSFEKYQLPNGLTVILSEDHRLPQVAVDIWYNVGAANQTPGKSGFAHLFEHMMFSGAKHIGPQPMKILESIGSVPGSMANGTTSFDRTNYFEVVPSKELPTALWLESDRMAFLLDTLDEKKLTVQRDVVSNERRQSYENRPYGTAFLRQCDLLYPKPHPYFNCVIGTLDDIQSASMEDLRQFFQQYYGPHNASLAIVGDFSPHVVKEQVAKYFGTIPSGPTPPKPDVPQPLLKEEVRETVVDKVAEVPKLVLAWNGVRPFSEDEAAGDLLSLILGEGKTSRLYRKLVFDKQVASQVGAANFALSLGGFFQIEVLAQTDRSVNELLPLTDEIVASIKKEGVTDEELNRAKRKILAGKLRGLERIGGLDGKADLLNSYQTYLGDPGYLPKDIARYRAVTKEDVKAFAEKYLPNDRRIVMDIRPTSQAAASR